MCTIFAWETACQKYFFQILSQKNAEVMNLKNPDLDLIRSILLECGYFPTVYFPATISHVLLLSQINGSDNQKYISVVWSTLASLAPPPPPPPSAHEILVTGLEPIQGRTIIGPWKRSHSQSCFLHHLFDLCSVLRMKTRLSLHGSGKLKIKEPFYYLSNDLIN